MMAIQLKRAYDTPQKTDEFRKRYFRELDAHPEEIKLLREKMRAGPLTIVFGSREERFNNAAALKEYREPSRGATPRRFGGQRKTVGAAR
jgi:uncharacterized protein YeaO (DUF488 family)